MPPDCLKKENILRGEAFSLAFSHVSRKVYTAHFTFLLAKSTDVTASIGVIIAKKKVKSAVKRNLCRRIIKEAFRLHRALFQNTMVIAIATKAASSADKRALWQSVDTFISKSKR